MLENINIKNFIEAVQNARLCMLVTSDKDTDLLAGQPIGIGRIDEDTTIWSFVKRSTQRSVDLGINKNIAIAIANKSSSIYLIIHGYATVVDDKVKMKTLWNPTMQARFPIGLELDDLILVKILPKGLDYWDSNTNKMAILFDLLKTIVAGKKCYDV